jgi:hypothetical protein
MSEEPGTIPAEAYAAWEAWWPGVGPWIGPGVDPADVAHEAFHTGWQAATSHLAAVLPPERARNLADWLDACGPQAGWHGTELQACLRQVAALLEGETMSAEEHAAVCDLPYGHDGGHWWNEDRAAVPARPQDTEGETP